MLMSFVCTIGVVVVLMWRAARRIRVFVLTRAKWHLCAMAPSDKLNGLPNSIAQMHKCTYTNTGSMGSLMQLFRERQSSRALVRSHKARARGSTRSLRQVRWDHSLEVASHTTLSLCELRCFVRSQSVSLLPTSMSHAILRPAKLACEAKLQNWDNSLARSLVYVCSCNINIYRTLLWIGQIVRLKNHPPTDLNMPADFFNDPWQFGQTLDFVHVSKIVASVP